MWKYCLLSLCLWLTSLASSITALAAVNEHNGILYLEQGNRLERYDLNAKSWLPSLPMPGYFIALHVDDSGIYGAFQNQSVTRFDLNGQNPTNFASLAPAITAIYSWQDYIYLVGPNRNTGVLRSYQKATLAFVASNHLPSKPFFGSALSASQGKIIGYDGKRLSGALYGIKLLPDGSFGTLTETVDPLSYWDNNSLFMSPGGDRFSDQSGAIYDTQDFSFIGKLLYAGNGMVFRDDGTIVVLADDELIHHDQRMVPIGRIDTGLNWARFLVAHGDELVVFSSDNSTPNGLAAKIFRMDQFVPDRPADIVAPQNLAYSPSDIFLDQAKVLHLYSKTHSNIFRWDTKTRQYIGSVPLIGQPDHLAYTATNDTLYLGYWGGLIDRIRFDQSELQEHFVTLRYQTYGLAAVGSYLFARDLISHNVYSPTKELLDLEIFPNHFYYSSTYVWNEGIKRLFFFNSESSPTLVRAKEIDPTGQFGAGHENTVEYYASLDVPIRVDDAGTKIVDASGNIYSAHDLIRTAKLPNRIKDAVWLGTDLVTIRAITGITQVQWWNEQLELETVRQIPGQPLRILRLEDSFLVVTSVSGVPRFYILGTDQELLFASTLLPQAPAQLSATNVTSDSITLQWQDGSDNEDGFGIFAKWPGSTNWTMIDETTVNVVSHVVTNLAFATEYELLVQAFNTAGFSTNTNTVSILTQPDPRIPRGTPFDLTVISASSTTIYLGWRDQATNEAGFKLERITGGSTDPDWQVVATLPANATNHVDNGLVSNTRYLYRIRAFNDFAESQVSPELIIDTLETDTLPPIGYPHSLRLIAALPKEVSISWFGSTVNEDFFVIERSSSIGTPTYEEVGRVPANTTFFSDQTVRPAHGYRYRVYATNAWGRAGGDDVLTVNTPVMGGTYLGLSAQWSNIVYFAFDGPPRLERFDLATTNWLAALALSQKPNALHVAEEGIYLGVSNRVSRYNHALQEPQILADLRSGDRDYQVQLIFTWGGHFFAGSEGLYLSGDRQTGILKWEGSNSTMLSPRISINDAGRMFARTTGFHRTDMVSYDLKTDGSISRWGINENLETNASAVAVFLHASRSRILDSTGIIISMEDLSLVDKIDRRLDDMVFYGDDVPIAASDKTIIAFSNTYQETGYAELSHRPVRIFLQAQNIFAFLPAADSSHGLKVEVIPLAQLNADEPNKLAELYGHQFTPDDVFVDKDEVVHLFSKTLQTIFRWSLVTQAELPAILTSANTTHVAYSETNHTIYLANLQGQITQINLELSLTEAPFAQVSPSPFALETLGELVFVGDIFSNGYPRHLTVSSDGQALSDIRGNVSKEYTWAETTRRLYQFRDDVGPNDILYEPISLNGQISNSVDSPYHHLGEVKAVYPIRVSPNGEVVVLGSGQIFEAKTLVLTNALGTVIKDAAWKNGQLHTIREFDGSTQLQTWSTNYTELGTRAFAGQPFRLLALDEGFLLITLEYGQPHLQLLDDGLVLTAENPINSPPTNISVIPDFILENNPTNIVIGQLLVDDADSSDTHRLELIADANGAFTLQTNALIALKRFDHETTTNVAITIRALDSHGQELIQTIPIEIRDVNEPPVGIWFLYKDLSENTPVGTIYQSIWGYDLESGENVTVELIDDADGHFVLTNGNLVVNAPLDYDLANEHQVTFRATDPEGLSFEQTFTIRVLPYIPPLPTGGLTLQFEPLPLPPQNELRTNNWRELGFWVNYWDGTMVINKHTNATAPSNGTFTLSVASTNEFSIHYTGDTRFKLIAFDIAELNPDSSNRQVNLEGYSMGGHRPKTTVVMDGVGDGSGSLRDFETVYLPEDFEYLDGVIISGAPVVIDNVKVLAYTFDQIYLWLRPIRTQAWEPTSENEITNHTGVIRFAVERFGELSKSVTCQLTFGGTATQGQDYTVVGADETGSFTLAVGQRSAVIELHPLHDSSDEPVETIEVALGASDAFDFIHGGALFHIHDDPMGAWFATEYPLQGVSEGGSIDPLADPDDNGLNNLTEFVMGRRAADRNTSPFSYTISPTSQGLSVSYELPKNPIAGMWTYQFASTSDFETWTPVTPVMTFDNSDPVRYQLHYDFELPAVTPVFIRLMIVPTP